MRPFAGLLVFIRYPSFVICDVFPCQTSLIRASALLWTVVSSFYAYFRFVALLSAPILSFHSFEQTVG